MPSRAVTCATSRCVPLVLCAKFWHTLVMTNSGSAATSHTSALTYAGRTAPRFVSDFIDDAVYAAERRNAGLDRVTEPDCWTGTCGHTSGAECLASMRPAPSIAERRVASVFAASVAADEFASF